MFVDGALAHDRSYPRKLARECAALPWRLFVPVLRTITFFAGAAATIALPELALQYDGQCMILINFCTR
jgi:hypothetical protein